MKRTPKYYTVQLPCRGYISQYYQSIYGNPLRADTSTPIGCFLNAALEKNIYGRRNVLDSFLYKSMTDKIVMKVNAWQFARIGFDLSDARVLQINQMLEANFDLALYQFCDARIKIACRYKGYHNALRLFCWKYKIDEAEHLETLKQLEYRFRKKMEKKSAKNVEKILC